ncbi:FixH family protein [Gemmatimonas groenlandica]|uniref:Auxin-binding protein n=1 Tax=Gemmatimonas groenlandica TaxID=2732249 RepID=A0A6M4IUL0_9BACT|nr:FixH family protein [Gemmatimonas groenlandica]QJR37865.1 Auxin-binding protein [Gemmatimonas groenlandica]
MSTLIDSRVRRSVARAAAVALALTALSLLTGCMMFAKAPSDLDYARTRRSEVGLYVATIHPTGDSIPRGKLHQWTLHLETSAGVPVDSANVSIDGGMPQHGHGLPTKPRVTRALGHGDHMVEGMKFNMGGWWVVKFRISAASGRDSLVFNLSL